MSEAEKIFREKIERYLSLREEMGAEAAYEKMLEGYPERQKKYFSEFIGNGTLAEGFTRAIEHYKQIGMVMEVLDVSNDGMDAVIEIQKVCPHVALNKEYDVDVCKLLCDMDIEATKRAFPKWKADYIARKTEGDCICAYKYERKAAKKKAAVAKKASAKKKPVVKKKAAPKKAPANKKPVATKKAAPKKK